MEEKERYEIHMYDDCNVDLYNNGVLDKSITNEMELEKLLNQQDKHIKELELLLKADKKIKTNSLNGFEKLKHENQQLKEDCVIYKSSINELYKSQKQLAIDELEKIKKFLIEKIAEKQACFDSGCYNDFEDGVKTICEILVWEIDKRVKILEEL